MSNRVPRFLYKYLRRDYAKAMVTGGAIRIGTLREYRNVEQHGPAIGDPYEGATSAVDPFCEADHPKPLPPSRVGLLVPGDERLSSISIYATREYFQIVEEWPDCYVYCLSQRLDVELMREFGADAVVKIREPLRFFGALTRCVRRRVNITGYLFGSCGYQSRVHSFEVPSSIPGFIKDPGYSYQREVRAVWLTAVPADRRDTEVAALVRKGYTVSVPPSQHAYNELEPVIIKCRGITNYCSLVSPRTQRPSTSPGGDTQRQGLSHAGGLQG